MFTRSKAKIVKQQKARPFTSKDLTLLKATLEYYPAKEEKDWRRIASVFGGKFDWESVKEKAETKLHYVPKPGKPTIKLDEIFELETKLGNPGTQRYERNKEELGILWQKFISQVKEEQKPKPIEDSEDSMDDRTLKSIAEDKAQHKYLSNSSPSRRTYVPRPVSLSSESDKEDDFTIPDWSKPLKMRFVRRAEEKSKRPVYRPKPKKLDLVNDSDDEPVQAGF